MSEEHQPEAAGATFTTTTPTITTDNNNSNNLSITQDIQGKPVKASNYKDWSHYRTESNDALRRGKEPAQTFPQKLVSTST